MSSSYTTVTIIIQGSSILFNGFQKLINVRILTGPNTLPPLNMNEKSFATKLFDSTALFFLQILESVVESKVTSDRLD